MSFQILSDLHSESNMKDALNAVSRLTKKANILVVPGDIGSFYKIESMFTLFKKMLEKFEHVVYVPGNHEYYYPIDASTKRKTPGELFYHFKKGLTDRPDLKKRKSSKPKYGTHWRHHIRRVHIVVRSISASRIAAVRAARHVY